MKLMKLSQVLRILCGIACKGVIEGTNIEDIGWEIIKKYNLKSDSQLEIHSISCDNIISDGSYSYSLDDASPLQIFSEDATFMSEGEYQPLPESMLHHKKIGDEVLLISKTEDGSIDGIFVYSDTGDLRVEYDYVGENQFVPINSEFIDYASLNETFYFGNKPETSNMRNLENLSSVHESASRRTQGACTTFKVIELAVAWESSFCSRNGSKNNANKKAMQIVAGVSLKYQQAGLCTKVKISHMEGYCSPSTDPYKQFVDLNNSGCGVNGLLQGFQNYWNQNRATINRDDAQLFSGTGLECSGDSCVIGCAYIGALCNGNSYGVNYASFTGNANSVQVLVAHELGHNCGAGHFNTQGHIMNPSVNEAAKGFSQPSINSFLSQFSRSSCIGDEPTTECKKQKIEDSCEDLGCHWSKKKNKCKKCKDSKKKNKCTQGGCVWDPDLKPNCVSCIEATTKVDCISQSCVWTNGSCLACRAGNPNKNQCTGINGCVWKKDKCISCRELKKSQCAKKDSCTWNKSGKICETSI